MARRNIPLIVVLMALLAGCHALFGRKSQQPAQSLLSHAAAADDTATADNTKKATPDIDMNHLLGRINPAADKRFVKVKAPHADRKDAYLLDEVYRAFVRMHNAARKDGISLKIVSATRTFHDQRRIWQRKWTGAQSVDGRNLARKVPNPIERARIILKYSSMPGTSRHHWGTDIDINSVENAYFKSAQGRRVYAWLAAHAADYGFCQVYTPKGNDRPQGYEEEPWHWSYCPIANQYLGQYTEKVTYAHISGFSGDRTAPQIDVIKNYVLGINPKCLNH
jgi:LAS superfamily LD-carboxypeptidase LdcB